MSKIIMYTTSRCPYCLQAERLLKSKGFAIEKINIEASDALEEEMIRRTKRRTVPQIFIGEVHVGGYDDMVALDRQGKLDPLLAGVGKASS